jgi:hypothetical protein
MSLLPESRPDPRHAGNAIVAERITKSNSTAEQGEHMEQQRAPGIGKIATKYGLIQGVVSFVMFLIVTLASVKQTWIATVIDVIALIVLMVLAHREYKRTHEGIMSYAQGLGSGVLLAVVASVLMCVLLFIYVSYINPGYPAAALQLQKAALEQRGMTGAQLDQALMITRAALTPVGLIITNLLSGAIGGLIVALIVSIFTKVSDPRAVI